MPDIAKSWNNKLKKLRQKMKGWAKNFYGKRRKEKILLQTTLHDLQKIKEERAYTQAEEDLWINSNNRLEEILQEEEEHWKLRSKQLWLEGGDANTKYFHTVASHRSKKNQIHSLEIDNNTSSNLVEIRNHIVSYYKELLGTSGFTYGHLDHSFWNEEDKLTNLEPK